jgi:hypothetical protein
VGDLGFGTTNRCLSFAVDSNHDLAMRVTMVDLEPPHDVCNGQKKWVGEPFRISEAPTVGGPGEPGFWAAALQDEPYFTDWSQYDAVRVFDEQIVPNSLYHLQAISVYCSLDSELEFSPPLEIRTSEFGDVVGMFYEFEEIWTPPLGTRDYDDITACVDKFRSRPFAPLKARVDVGPCAVDFKVDFTDIPCIVDGFRGMSFPCPPADKCQQ